MITSRTHLNVMDFCTLSFYNNELLLVIIILKLICALFSDSGWRLVDLQWDTGDNQQWTPEHTSTHRYIHTPLPQVNMYLYSSDHVFSICNLFVLYWELIDRMSKRRQYAYRQRRT